MCGIQFEFWADKPVSSCLERHESFGQHFAVRVGDSQWVRDATTLRQLACSWSTYSNAHCSAKGFRAWVHMVGKKTLKLTIVAIVINSGDKVSEDEGFIDCLGDVIV